ncbi:sulfotransferase [Patescibacteria group bacterium]|nr:sulfotransferase [Patescibacteria group bacterium]
MYDTMKLPNFLIIGATKAGTTSLHHYLGQHPEIYMLPQKETNFFAQESSLCMLDRTVTNKQEYLELFKDANNEKIIGETSPAYLCVIDAPKRIFEMIPDVKLTAILRNPTERAYSHYLMRRRQNKEARESFEEVIEDIDIDPMRSYKSRGFYGEQLERYFKYFTHEQLKIFLYEDFTSSPQKVIKGLCEFLEVDTTFTPDTSNRFNVNPPAEEPISPKMRKKLIDLYHDDIELAQKLIGIDLSGWMKF